jgi:hypothetical protein
MVDTTLRVFIHPTSALVNKGASRRIHHRNYSNSIPAIAAGSRSPHEASYQPRFVACLKELYGQSAGRLESLDLPPPFREIIVTFWQLPDAVQMVG